MRTTRLPRQADAFAPDGSAIRRLARTAACSVGHATLEADRTSGAIRHRTVSEVWYVLSGEGELWRALDGEESVVTLTEGVCAEIPLGTAFQFRALGERPLRFLLVTTPPWPGEGEAEPVNGPWT